jgi:hypothetical protein
MITISQAVNEIINEKPFLNENLKDAIINLSSFSRQIKPQIEKRLKKKIKIGAIVMALKRYSHQSDVKTEVLLRSALLKLGDIIIRSNLSDYTFANSDTLIKKHIKLVNIIHNKNDIFFTYVQGVFESNWVISNLLDKELIKIFKEEKLISCNRSLASVTVKLPLENTMIPGFYYFLLRKIAWEGINIVEVVSTTNEFTIIVKEKIVEKLFNVIKTIVKKA